MVFKRLAATVIINCDRFYKLRRYYKMRQSINTFQESDRVFLDEGNLAYNFT